MDTETTYRSTLATLQASVNTLERNARQRLERLEIRANAASNLGRDHEDRIMRLEVRANAASTLAQDHEDRIKRLEDDIADLRELVRRYEEKLTRYEDLAVSREEELEEEIASANQKILGLAASLINLSIPVSRWLQEEEEY